MYESVKSILGEQWISLKRILPEEACSLLKQGFSRDYVQFLEEIGGPIHSKIFIYEGPVKATDIYTTDAIHLEAIALIGDDMQGYCTGFDAADGMRLVEVDPWSKVEPLPESNFRDWLDGVIGDNS